jgi:hypothetical protein
MLALRTSHHRNQKKRILNLKRKKNQLPIARKKSRVSFTPITKFKHNPKSRKFPRKSRKNLSAKKLNVY